ncbi:nuclear transport factor 2 family protein [Lysobacter auxotrophicus]|uniref:Nuclear transport factor 2 family protein n=1 Tax=Lysobacter auxotrophicus TaxID=2992573 RepID=A0ABN6UFR6_9GAMM|nr:nuclear transport factor 2 family protein [Lysobacter auxotrophicus]BDU15169.1 nuclear transport factor 2 family protein [Lysobacter auxotrophicus]
MKKFMSVAAVLMAATISSTTVARTPRDPSTEQAGLSRTIASLDTAVFDAFNRCDVPVQLRKHASYFAPDVEFYHDTGGVTWSREEMLANTRQYVCGKFRRELVPGSLKVFPIKEFGAIEQGTHRFCQFGSGKCEGIADFTIVWENRDGAWRITRVLSYGHRAND